VKLKVFAGLPREVAVLTAVAFAVAVGFGIVVPALPLFARHFGVNNAAAGAVISAFAFMRLVSALASGRLVDRFGERLIMATGIGIVAVSSAIAGLAQTYNQLVVLRGAGGIGSAMFTVSAMSLLLRVAGAEQRGRATGLWQSGFLLGAIAGPALGGFVLDISLRAPFFLYAGTLAVAGTIGMAFLTHVDVRTTAEATDLAPVARKTLPQALQSSGFRAAVMANFGVGWALFGVRTSLVPIFVGIVLNESGKWIGIGFLLSAAAQAALLLPVGKFVDSTGRRPAMIIGGTIATVSMLVLAASQSLVPYLVAMTMFGLGSAFLSVAPSAAVGDVIEGRGGAPVAAFQMAADLGAVAGPVAAGWLADDVSYSAGFGVTAGVLALGLLAAIFSRETRPSARPRQTESVAPHEEGA
jgi:MFS family permease